MTATVPAPLLTGFDLLERWLAHRDECLAVGGDMPDPQPASSDS